jgi:hypothetical protein
MDALIIFCCLLIPTFFLNFLASGRDQLLFETHPGTPRLVVAGLVALGFLGLTWLGFSTSWALALVLPGPIGAFLGNWAGSGGWIILRFRLFGR